MTERELIRILNSKRWKPTRTGWTISIETCAIEARKERRLWQARANDGERWSRWTAFVDTRWRAGLMARASLLNRQLELDL
ncbi:MAG: hypothetical protein ACR2OX_06405 [Methyloligellaceae bacterium]